MSGDNARSMGLFLCWLAILVVGSGAYVWQRMSVNAEHIAKLQKYNAAQQGSMQFYQRASAFMRTGMTRSQIEAQLPSPESIVAPLRKDADGMTYDIVTYEDPATGGRIRIDFRPDGTWSHTTTAEPARPDLSVPELAVFTNQVRQRLRDAAAWLWGPALLWFLFATRREQRLARGLLLLGVALAFVASVATEVPWSGRLRKWWQIDDIWWSLTLLGISALVVSYVWRNRKPINVLICPKCGYDLRESPERCPECGTPSPPRGLRLPTRPQEVPWQREHPSC